MQIFCPYPSPLECAKALWNDSKRFNKQIIECKQILDAIDGVGTGWFNHPVVKMYKPYKDWLVNYACCLQAYRNYMKYKNVPDWTSSAIYRQAVMYSEKADKIRPPFLTEEFRGQHKCRLYTKSPESYSQFAKYGKSDINYYFVEGELLKYKDGKRIK